MIPGSNLHRRGLAGQVREVATKTLREEYRHIRPEEARVLLFDGGSVPLAMFGPKLSAMAARDLKKWVSSCRLDTADALGGFLGWVAWLFIHFGFLTGWRNRIGALFGWWYAFTRDLRREHASSSTTCRSPPTAAKPVLRLASRRRWPVNTRYA